MVCNSKMLDSVTDTARLILCSYEIIHFSALLKKKTTKKPNKTKNQNKKTPTKLSEVNAASLLLENILISLKIGANQSKRQDYRAERITQGHAI